MNETVQQFQSPYRIISQRIIYSEQLVFYKNKEEEEFERKMTKVMFATLICVISFWALEFLLLGLLTWPIFLPNEPFQDVTFGLERLLQAQSDREADLHQRHVAYVTILILVYL